MTPALLVFVGGGLGAVARYALTLAAARAFGPQFPWGTFGVNVSGSLLMGLVAGFFVVRAGLPAADDVRLFLTTGVLGGFTTFSAFSLDTIMLWERGGMGALMLYVFGSVVLSIAALFIGYALAKGIA
jgi:CrcB protein